MTDPANTEPRQIGETARISVPSHVVYRAFVTETVALNIETGQYHGLNSTAGRMLEELERRGTVAGAAPALAQEFEQPVDRIRVDLVTLCETLHARGLIVVGEPDAAS